MTREQILTLLDRRKAAFDRRDADALERLHAENGVVESLVAGTVTGRPAIGEVYRAWFAAFPDLVTVTDVPIVDGTRASLSEVMTGTAMGAFMGLPPTQKPFRLSIVHLYEFEDGQILHERRIYDFTGLLLQIGALKAKPA